MSTKQYLEKLRNRLLDLTLRNRLLNFKYSNKSLIRVVDEVPEVLFKKLSDGKELTFVPVPEPQLDSYVEESSKSNSGIEPGAVSKKVKPPVKEFAESIGINTSFELLAKSKMHKAQHNDDEIQTLLYADELERSFSRLYTQYRTALEETGNNLLYLTFGALEYYESEDSQEPKKAPLIVFPVRLKREKPQRGNPYYRFVIYGSGEEPSINLTLVEKLKREFSLNIPSQLTDGEDETSPANISLEAYLESIRVILLRAKPSWKIIYESNLCILNFGKLVLYKDLQPESWIDSTEQIEDHPLVQAICFGEGVEELENSGLYADDYSLDDLPAKSIPNLIYDADSSQHSALIDALSGKNLVIEGPPGTGKSQTITNLIAAAMIAGKKVLFVAEKLAALEVVKKRLDVAGLGDFCLELHSTKIQKKAVLESLKRRLDGKYDVLSKISAKRKELDDYKIKINDYVRAINTKMEFYPITFSEGIGRYSLLKSELEEKLIQTSDFVDIAIIVPANVDESFLKQELEKIRIYFSVLEKIISTSGRIDDHPWYHFKFDSSCPLTAEDYLSKTLELHARLVSLVEQLNHIENCPVEQFSIQSFKNINHQFNILKSVDEHMEVLTPQMFDLLLNQGFESISELQGHLKQITVKTGLISNAKCAGIMNYEIEKQEVRELTELLSKLEIKSANLVSELSPLQLDLKLLKQTLEEMHKSSQEIASQIGMTLPNSFSDCVAFYNALRNCSSIRDIEKGCILAVLQIRNDITTYNLVKNDVKLAFECLSEIESIFNRSSLRMKSSDILNIINNLKQANWFSLLFNKQHKIAQRWLELAVQYPHKPKFSQLFSKLEKLYEFLLIKEKLERDPGVIKILGSEFNGINTNLSALDHALNVVEDFIKNWESLSPFTSDGKTIVERLASLSNSDFTKIQQVINRQAELIKSTSDLKQHFQLSVLDKEIQVYVDLIQSQISVIEKITLRPFLKECHTLSLNELSVVLDWASEYTHSNRQANEIARKFAKFGFDSADFSKLVKQLSSFKSYYSAVSEFQLPAEAKSKILSSTFFEYLTDSSAHLRNISNEIGQVQNLIKTVGLSLQNIDGMTPLGLLEYVELPLTQKDRIYEWENLFRLKQIAQRGMFGQVLPVIESKGISASVAVTICELIFIKLVVQKHQLQDERLNLFDTTVHENIRSKFIQLDKELQVLTRAEIASSLATNYIPAGNTRGPTSTWTDSALIKRELDKAQRHIPVRQLINRAGSAIRALKPCFMMSPLSVAQFLPPGKIEFDLIVMDEASQLRPEEALGAIARGKQLIVVGDTKQLPPTSFFGTEDDDNDIDSTDDKFESILEQAAGVFRPARRLKWHYRSQHESLIAFSNSQFYDSELIIFPTPNSKSEEYGIKYRYLPDGVYEGSGKNTVEAQALIEAISYHASKYPSKSLGVVTMNAAQRDLIEDLLLNASKTDPTLSDFISNGESKGEKFFIKNIENVQGDERDVIFVSVTYGRDSNGAFHHRFGPINQRNGYRRLNVLFTRAKIRMEIFCSFEPELLAGASSLGAQTLKGFLEFARSGKLPVQENISGKSFDSPFEISVARAIEKLGYQVTPQVGVAGYFIDLAVVDPVNPGRYILGVECDGATYHSSKSARDRDRLRQQNLENLGWSIHRVWSTDWFRNEKREIIRLKNRIEAQYQFKSKSDLEESNKEAGDSLKTNALRQIDTEKLRALLIELREQVIKRNVTDVPPEQGILRKTILDLVVSKIPLTKGEFELMLEAKKLKYATSHEQFVEDILNILRSLSAK